MYRKAPLDLKSAN